MQLATMILVGLTTLAAAAEAATSASYSVGLRHGNNPVHSYRAGMRHLWGAPAALAARFAPAAAAAAGATPASYSFGLALTANPVGSYAAGLAFARGLGDGSRRAFSPRISIASVNWGERYTANPIGSYNTGLHHQIAAVFDEIAATVASISTTTQWGEQHTVDAIPSHRAGLATRIALALMSIYVDGFDDIVTVGVGAGIVGNRTTNTSADAVSILLPGISSYQHGSLYAANDSPSYRAGLGHKMA